MIRWLIPVICFLAVGVARGDDPPPRSEPPDAAKPAAPDVKPAAAKPKADAPVPASDAELLKSLEKQAAPEQPEENPLDRVGRRMRDVQGRLVKTDPGAETRGIQTEIIRDLDQLIEAMKKGGG